MITKLKKILSFIIVSFVLMIGYSLSIMPVPAVSAQSLWDSQTGMNDEIGMKAYKQSGEPNDIRKTIISIIRIALEFLALIFVLLILYSGFKWMTAAGNEENIKTAKSTIIAAVIGLTIILCAWSITFFVLESLADATSDTY